MMEFYDLHSHVLPGLSGDDGSDSREISEQMLEQAFACGTRHIVATPHVMELNSCVSWQEIQDKVNELQEIAPCGLKVYPGAELMLNWDLLQLFKEQGAFSMNGSRYALVELPMYEVPRYTEEFFFEMQVLGKIPVLAHPERYRSLWSNPDRLLSWLKRGVLLQINAGSVLGKFGSAVKSNAEILLENHVVSCVGSDAHGTDMRNTDISAEMNRIKELVGEKEALLIAVENPRKVLADEVIELNIPEKLVLKDAKKSFWQKIFG